MAGAGLTLLDPMPDGRDATKFDDGRPFLATKVDVVFNVVGDFSFKVFEETERVVFSCLEDCHLL